MMTTSDELRAWRAAKRWTQQQVADQLGYSLRAYAEYEKPGRELPLVLALALVGVDAMAVEKSPLAPRSFHNPQDTTACYVKYDELASLPRGSARIVGLLSWVERYGDAMTNALRPTKAPSVQGANS